MADVEIGTLYDLNKQIMSQLPPQDPQVFQKNLNLIGAGFSSTDKRHGFMLMCKERSDFTILHIVDANYLKTLEELQEILQERGTIVAIQYVHGEDAFEIWVKDDKDEVFMFMLFEASGMIVNIE